MNLLYNETFRGIVQNQNVVTIPTGMNPDNDMSLCALHLTDQPFTQDNPVDIEKVGGKDIPIACIDISRQHIAERGGVRVTQGESLYHEYAGLRSLDEACSHGIFCMVVHLTHIYVANCQTYRCFNVLPGTR